MPKVRSCIALSDAINDEENANAMYRDLIKQMSEEGVITKKDMEKMETIMEQETIHAKWLRQMFKEITCTGVKEDVFTWGLTKQRLEEAMKSVRRGD